MFPKPRCDLRTKGPSETPTHRLILTYIYLNKKAFCDPTVVPLSVSKRCKFSPGHVLKINWKAALGILISCFQRNHEYVNTQTWNYWIHKGPLWVFRRCGISAHTCWPKLQTGCSVVQRAAYFHILIFSPLFATSSKNASAFAAKTEVICWDVGKKQIGLRAMGEKRTSGAVLLNWERAFMTP